MNAETETTETSTRAPQGMNKFPLFFVPFVFAVAGLVFIPQILSHQREQRLLRHGRPAVAELLSIRETGNLYNRNPEVKARLRVQPADGEAFELEVTKVLRMTELAKYTEGSSIEVRYDPARRDDVALVRVAKPDAAPKPSAR
jgi:hypothetical protein